jgi:hypothetical protein
VTGDLLSISGKRTYGDDIDIYGAGDLFRKSDFQIASVRHFAEGETRFYTQMQSQALLKQKT